MDTDVCPRFSDPDVGRDVLQLVQCVRLLSDSVSGEMAYEMEKALEYLQTPERAAELVMEDMLCNDRWVTRSSWIKEGRGAAGDAYLKQKHTLN